MPKRNKAVTRTILGREEIIGDSNLSKSENQSKEPVRVDSVAKPSKLINKNAAQSFSNSTQKRAPSPAESRGTEPMRPKSPLRPPPFYTVRLSNAPIFLRRTTLRPSTLEFLNRTPSPRRSPSPVERSSSRSPASRGQSPVRQEVFVQKRDAPANPIKNQFNSTAEEQKIIEENIIKLINESVQTGPLKKTHGTQMTPYDSEASDISGI